MFIINPAPTFEGTVQIPVPGQQATAPLALVFKHMGRAEYRAWVKRAAQVAAIQDDAARDQADTFWLAECIHGWAPDAGPTTAAGEPVPFGIEALGQLLNAYPLASQAIYQHYGTSLFEARLGN